jgi:iron complex outermembrane recepter protein
MPAVVETLTAKGIERINTVETSDAFKYMPGSYLRKLYPGLTNQPLVIRGNNSEMTGRTLVMMDGIRISDFTAAGNSNGPKWFLVSPHEIEQVDVIYGPYSAALSGNSLSGTAMITTHFPEKMEIKADTQYFYQNFHEYKTDEDIHGYNTFASFGDKLGRFSYNVWYNRLDTDIQPISFVTKKVSEGAAPAGRPVTGVAQDTDPTGADRLIFGSPGVSDLVDNTVKAKFAYDLTPYSQLRLVSAFWNSEQEYDSPETYLRDAAGNPVYSGRVIVGGRSYNLGNTSFTYSKREMQNLLNGITYSLDMPGSWKVNAVLSSFNILKDLNRVSGTAAPGSKDGGPGTVTDADGGWYTGDLSVGRVIQGLGVHTLAAGYHYDRYRTDSEAWRASDWLWDDRTSLSLDSEGKTETNAFYLEDTWKITDQWTVYLGGRYEWWRGFDGEKATDVGAMRVTTELEDKDAEFFSPKFSTTFSPTENWRLRFSMALAERFPTVGELFFGGVNAQGIVNNANPGLKPERSFAKDFTITRQIGHDGEARLTFFEDDVDDAIYTQTNVYTNIRNYQNVDEVRTRGIEFALNKRHVLLDGLGVFTNVAWLNSKILRNDSVPDSVGKTFPRVPEWRVKCVLDYAPTETWALTFAGHYASHQFGTLDNSDPHDGYGAIDEFLVFDAKFTYRLPMGFTASVGVDNLTDESYHVSHPYPRRTYLTEVKWKF